MVGKKAGRVRGGGHFKGGFLYLEDDPKLGYTDEFWSTPCCFDHQYPFKKVCLQFYGCHHNKFLMLVPLWKTGHISVFIAKCWKFAAMSFDLFRYCPSVSLK